MGVSVSLLQNPSLGPPVAGLWTQARPLPSWNLGGSTVERTETPRSDQRLPVGVD